MARQIWRRLGHIFSGNGPESWIAGYASYPTPLVLDNSTVRVFFSPRDSHNRSSITALDLALEGERFEILSPPTRPLLSPGRRGSFDDSGVTVSCVVPRGAELLVYYLGWSLGTTVPFRNFIGLAVGERNAGPLRRISPAPILDRSAIDPYTLGYPWVIREEGAWRMWYGSHLEWGEERLEMRHVIKEAWSTDGLQWQREGRIAIPLAGGAEFAVSRPCVIRDADRTRMWYARRDPHYRIGYAELIDGTWIRQDDSVSFAGTAGHWDSESITYPAVFDHGGHRYMLHNGNGYGRTGFGISVLEARD
jgi:hypothetical protein